MKVIFGVRCFDCVNLQYVELSLRWSAYDVSYTNALTPGSNVLLETLYLLDEKFSAFYGVWRFVAAITI
jgi:hypothetical protein